MVARTQRIHGSLRVIPVKKKLCGLFECNINIKQPRQYLHRSALVKGGKVHLYGEPTLGGVPDICSERGRSCHAEMNVIKRFSKSFKSRKISKFEIWVVRCDRNGDLVNSKPCRHCRNSLLRLGIHKIVYTNEEGDFIKADLRYLDDCYISSGSRY